jgi:hypothetical protein
VPAILSIESAAPGLGRLGLGLGRDPHSPGLDRARRPGVERLVLPQRTGTGETVWVHPCDAYYTASCTSSSRSVDPPQIEGELTQRVLVAGRVSIRLSICSIIFCRMYHSVICSLGSRSCTFGPKFRVFTLVKGHLRVVHVGVTIHDRAAVTVGFARKSSAKSAKFSTFRKVRSFYSKPHAFALRACGV